LWENVKDLPIIPYLDVLVDGPYIENLRDVSLPWRGSSNQRVIDVKASLKTNKVVVVPD
jgi:anaerobic ribonucleoside-triphosphate reductase activating protein